MSEPSSPLAPNTARVASLSHWARFFHPQDGIFRSPSDQGESIEHLDIDLRYVEHEYVSPTVSKDKDGKKIKLPLPGKVALPNVCRLTLRGGEYVQDSEERMDCLAEVLAAITPIEVRWLNAFDHPAEQQTLSTAMVHPAIIAAGELWSSTGGFPCPNLTAPTPFSLTPATTPAPSPGPRKTTFGALPGMPFSGLPALSTIKPKIADDHRFKEREERRRLADYSLKPRFEYAFGPWGVEELRWRFDGRYTPAGIKTIITHLFRALAASFPSCARTVDCDLPSLVTFSPLPESIISDIQSLVHSLELDSELSAYLADVALVSLDADSGRYARVFEDTVDDDNTYRASRRLKADMLLLTSSSGGEVVSLADLAAAPGTEVDIDDNKPALSLQVPDSPHADKSPAGSFASLGPGATDAGFSTDEEGEAMTPEMNNSLLVEPTDPTAAVGGNSKVSTDQTAQRLMSASLML